MPKLKKPSYSLHRPSGQARCRINGRDHYLGEFDSPASRERYDDLIREFYRSSDLDRYRLTIDELAVRYIDFALTYYVKDGRTTSEVDCVRYALRPLVKMFGTRRCRDFGPLLMKQYRDELIRLDFARKTINGAVGRVRRMFRWATENEVLPVEVYQALAAVAGLRAGRSTARETSPVMPVADDVINATLTRLPRIVADMVRLQWLTGMRPGEVTALRPQDITFGTDDVWTYRPASHKSQHHGRERVVFIGIRGQEILRSYLNGRNPDAFIFSPAESEDERRKTRHHSPRAKRPPKARYMKDSYCRVVARACEVAFGMPDALRRIPASETTAEHTERKRLAAVWRSEHCWSPNQLRHAKATEIRERFGLESAQVCLGHSNANVTQVYAERDHKQARHVMQQIG